MYELKPRLLLSVPDDRSGELIEWPDDQFPVPVKGPIYDEAFGRINEVGRPKDFV